MSELIDTCRRCHSTAFRGPYPSESGGSIHCAQCGREWGGETAPRAPDAQAWEAEYDEARERGWEHYDD